VGVDLPELHVGNDIGTERSGVQPQRSIPQQHVYAASVGDGKRAGLPVDASHVPLQWLDIHMGSRSQRRNQRLYSQHSAEEIYGAIRQHHVTHLCCAPIVFNILLDHPQPVQPLPGRVEVLTGGAPPPPPILCKMEDMGFLVTHAYGLTEATGPALACEWKSEWDDAQLSPAERGALKGRQGVGVLSLEQVDVKNPVTMSSVPRMGRAWEKSC
jgi:acyl-CoA synthetase (AMP-forming)/AMP-acid ligase II